MESQDYQKQANDFLSQTGTTLEIEFLKNDYHFIGDNDKRDIYKCTLKRGKRKFVFNFGQSLMDSQHYQDIHIKSRLYTMTGKNLCGGYKIDDMAKYKDYIKLINGKKPTNYSVLACLTKYDPCTFEDFCKEYGYDEDSKKAEKIYKGVLYEYQSLCMLFSYDEMNQLSEIQ